MCKDSLRNRIHSYFASRATHGKSCARITFMGGGGMRKRLSRLVPVVLFGLFFSASLLYASPSKAINSFWNSPADYVSSKTGMKNLDLENCFLYTDYSRQLLKFGVAHQIKDFFWWGLEYKGNFFPSDVHIEEDYNSLSAFPKAIKTTSIKIENDRSLYDLENELLFTGCFPTAVPGVPMGFQVGFRVGGAFYKNYYAISDGGEFSVHSPVVTGEKWSKGSRNELLFTSKISYAASIPLERYTFTPSLTASLGINPRSEKTKYTEIGGNSVTGERNSTEIVPDVTLDTELVFPRTELMTHLVGLEYKFGGDFLKNSLATKNETNANKKTQVERKQEQNMSNVLTARYRMVHNINQRLSLAWQVKLGFQFKNRAVPGPVAYTQDSRPIVPNTAETVVLTTTGSTKTSVRSGADDGFVYRTDAFSTVILPVLTVGMRYELKPSKLIFNAGAEITPFTYTYTDYNTYAIRNLENKSTEKKYENKRTESNFNKFSMSVGLGLSFYATPSFLIDTGMKIVADNSGGNLSFTDVLDQSELYIAINYNFGRKKRAVAAAMFDERFDVETAGADTDETIYNVTGVSR